MHLRFAHHSAKKVKNWFPNAHEAALGIVFRGKCDDMAGMTQDQAQLLAIRGLEWLAAQPEDVGVFLGQAGLAPGDLARRAGEPDFLGGVLSFLSAEDQRLLAASAALAVAPEDLARAEAVLNGELPHWT